MAVGSRATSVLIALTAIGFHVWLWQELLMGTRGMPRRYAGYLPQFEALHVGAAVAVVVFYVALAWLVLRVVRAPRAAILKS